MCKIISVADNKGGTGKTTTTVNLAAALSFRKKGRVLVIDNDPQSDATDYLLNQEVFEISDSVHSIYTGTAKRIEDCIYPTIHKNLDIIPNIPETSFTEIQLAKEYPDSLTTLRSFTYDYLQENYSYVLIDCPPTLSVFMGCALFASNCVLIPIDVGSTKSIKGVQAILDMKESVINSGNTDLTFLKILITKLDNRKKAHKKNRVSLGSIFGDENIFETVITTSTLFEQIESLYNETIFSYRPSSTAATSYRKLATELIKMF